MNKIFDPNGLFAQIMNVILGLILLNVLWIVCIKFLKWSLSL